ncbi:MAG TPA: hypothetical protein VGL46_21555 [Pseudonocardiaceae bacterium]|jgi:hypothetical protein
MNGDNPCGDEVADERERRIRLNPWARAADSQLGAWLDTLGARYAGCAVDEQGDRELRWIFPAGRDGTPGQRWRELLVRSLGGNRDRWELVYRESGESRLRGTVNYYASTSARGDLSQLRGRAGELVDAGLRHLARPVATCGRVHRDPRLLPGVTVAGVVVLLAVVLLVGLPPVVLLLAMPLIVLTGGWLTMRAIRVAFGLPM